MSSCNYKTLLGRTCMYAKSLQLCPTLCNPMDYSPPGSLSMGFSRQEHWSGLPCSPPWDLLSLRDRSHIYSSSDITDGFLTAEPWGQALENSGPTTILMSGLSHLLLSLICCLWPFLCHTTISLQSYDGWSMWTNDEGLMSPDHEGQH